LIHEVTHQVMHEWLPVMPLWLGEGLAEYLSAVPYQNGRFEFKNSVAGLKESLLEDYRISEGREVTIYRPHELVDLSNAGWSGVSMDYLSAMMLTYYFVHLDQPEKTLRHARRLPESARSIEGRCREPHQRTQPRGEGVRGEAACFQRAGRKVQRLAHYFQGGRSMPTTSASTPTTTSCGTECPRASG
jgi:hypothetical protein